MMMQIADRLETHRKRIAEILTRPTGAPGGLLDESFVEQIASDILSMLSLAQTAHTRGEVGYARSACEMERLVRRRKSCATQTLAARMASDERLGKWCRELEEVLCELESVAGRIARLAEEIDARIRSCGKTEPIDKI